MFRASLILAVFLGGCATQYVGTIAESEDDLPVRRAFFAEPPDALSDAFRAACDAPGDVFKSLNATTDQCLIPPTPDGAACLLLSVDGALEAPRLIMQKQSKPDGDGTLVEMSYFAEVPQKSGPARRVYFLQPRLDALVDSMLINAGGETR